MRDLLRIGRNGLIAFIMTLLIGAVNCLAGERTLAWDPNCNDYPNLIGYNLYYKAGSSVSENPDGANLIYIPLTEPGFDPDQPSYQVTGLLENVRYYFTVTALYNDDESAMSNEVSGMLDSDSGTLGGSPSGSSSDVNSTADSSTGGSSSAGCFIDSLK
jgi:hypothetical protein